VARASLPSNVTFIGGHPMAGSELAGVEYARADLFDRAVYALAVEPETEQAQVERLMSLVAAIGARPLVVEPEAHDAAVGMVSHLPQLLATALASLMMDGAGNHELAAQLAAGGWRDMTRLGASSWSVWRDICLTNQPNLAAALGLLLSELQTLKEALEARDFGRVKELFEAANRATAEQRARHYQSFERLKP
jgi:prephenate dehydrogenase